MKKIATLLVLLLTYFGNAQTATVNYSPTTAAINNPERGFYRHTEVHSASYSGLDQNTLNGYKSSNTTLLLRVFYLENFINAPISSSYLSSMQSDFNKIRSAGLKCIVRFAYSDNINGALDASKAQILAHIQQVKPMLIANVDVIATMQAGFIGSWGEWYYTNYFGMSPTTADYANRKEVVDAILAALPSSRMVQLRTPTLKQKTYTTTTALSQSQAFNGTNIARLGHHNDCFLSSSTDFGTYNNVSTEYPYLQQETKYTPMGGETCAVNEPRSKCTTAVSEMQQFHWSYLNFDYNPNVISGFQSDGCFSEIQNKLGYRFELVNGTYPQSASKGNTMSFSFKILNTGYAATYNQRTVYLVLRNASSNQEYSVALNTDPRFWTSGVQQTITENVTLPSNMITGTYNLFLNLPDTNSTISSRPEYSIRLANNSTWEANTGYNNLLHAVNVTTSLGVSEAQKLDLKIYPIPTNNELIIEMDNLNDFKIAIFNLVGQNVNAKATFENNKVTLNTETLSDGIYLVQFQNNELKETRKIIVRH
jgi:hypothetical protein